MAKQNLSRKNNKSMAKTMSKKELSHIVSVRILIMAAVNLVGIATLLALRREAMVELAFVNYWLTPLAIVFGVLIVMLVVRPSGLLGKKIREKV